MKKAKNRILSVILSMGILSSLTVVPAKAEIKSSEDFESYSNISEVKGDGKLISGSSNAVLELRTEEFSGEQNQYLEGSGTGVQMVTNGILPDGNSAISMRIKFSSNNQQLILRSSKEVLYLLNVDGANKIRLLNDASTALPLVTDLWYELSFIADTDKKTISATLTDQLNGDSVSNTKSYTGDAANQIVKDAHLRIKINNGIAGIDDIVCRMSESVVFEQAGRMLSVMPELTFTTNCDMPLEAENILINGESGYISKVVNEGEGRYKATLSKPLDKDAVYTVSLFDYKDSEGLEAQFVPTEFKTRSSGLTMTKNNGVYVIKNELLEEETAVVAGISFSGDTIKEWDFERITLNGSESRELSMTSVDSVILMNNLTERIPYEVYSTQEEYDAPESDALLNVTYDEQNSVLKCAGTSPEGAGRQIIAAIMSESGESINLDTASKEDVKKAITYIRGLVTDINGIYSFRAENSFKTSRYKVCISGAADSEKAQSDKLLLVNPRDAEYVCEAVNGAKDIEAVKTALTEYAHVLDIDFELLNDMEDKSIIYQYVLNRKSDKEYASAGEISSDMKKAAVLYAINKANAEEARKFVDGYAAQLGFEVSETYPLWTALNDANKTAVIEKIHDREYTSAEKFLDRLQKYVIYTTIKTAKSYSQVREIIDNHYELLGVSIDKYESLNAQTYVARKLINKEYNEESFIAAFNGYVEEFEKLKDSGEIVSYVIMAEDFENYSNISELKGDGKFISSSNNANLKLRVEDNSGEKNQYLEVDGEGLQAVTNAILPEGMSLTSLRIRFSSNNQQLILRSSKEVLYLLNVDGGNNIRLLNDTATALALETNTWYELAFMADTDKKTISATLTNQLNGESVSNTKSYTGDAADQIIKDAHLRIRANSGKAGIDDIVCQIPATASFEQTGRVLSVMPELTFTTNCDMPLEAENILINGESGYIYDVVEEGNGRYRAFFDKPLDKGMKYTVSLTDYKNTAGLETQLKIAEFTTRSSGLTMTYKNGVYVVKNELSDTETAVIAGILLDGNTIKEWDFERISLSSGEEFEFSMPMASNVILMNNLTERIPYEIYITSDEKYEHTESGELLELVYDDENYILKCAGISPNGAGRPIIAGIISETDENIDFDTAPKAEILKAMPYIRGFVTDADGAYSFNTKTTFKSDRYKISISGISDREKTDSDKLLLINPQDAESLCAAINIAQNTESIKAALTEYAYVLNTDFELLNNMTDKSFIYKYVFDRKNEKAYVSAGGISSDMKTAAVLYAINKANAEEAYKLVDEHAVQLGFEETYSLWTALNDTNKTAVIEKIHNKEYTSAQDFLTRLQKHTAYMVIKTTERYSQVQEIIDNHYKLLGISLDKYKSLGAQTYVAKKMINKEYNETNFATDFNRYVEEFEKQNNKQSDKTTSNSGSITSSSLIIPQETKATLKPVKPVETVKELNDLDTVPWAKESITELYEKGIISGYSDGSFRPNQAITREEFVKLLISCFGLMDNSASCEFEDVPNDAWFRPYVASAKAKGIVSGISATKFGTGTNLTRQDMCTMVYRAINTLGIEMKQGEPIEFSDADSIAPYAAEAVNILSAMGIINGIEDKFAPAELCTRAQVAKVLYEIYSVSDIGDDSLNSGEPVETTVSEVEKGLVNAMGMLCLDEEEDRAITRGEFAGELVKLMGLEELANTIDDVKSYSDVDKFTENSGAIEYLSKSNIMAGYNNNTFGPNDAMNSHLAVAAVGKALGYAESLSDSDKIYETVILRGLPAIEDKELMYSEAVHLFYEALYCEVRRNNNNNLATQLENVFEIYESTGIVTATEITSLDGHSSAPLGQICIDNQAYTSEDFSHYLGYRVKYYYREEKSGDKTLVFAYPKGSKVLDIAAENIDDFKSRRLSYSEEGKKSKSIKIPLSADIIYNGKAFPNYSDEIFKPKAGNIRLIDSGNGYNTVIINEYTSGVLTKISPEKDKLYFEGGSSLSIDDIDYLFIENSEAKAITVDEIKAGTVVSYTQSKDNTVIKLIVSDMTLEGAIQTLRSDSTEVVIDGTEYKISPDFQPNMNVLKVGVPLYMYLDYCDLIVMAEAGENQREKLGYLIKTYIDEAGDTYIRLLTSDNELAYLQCKNKVKINDRSVSDDRVQSELCTEDANEAQLIRYRLDDTGKISWIETAVNRDSYTGLVSDTADTERLYIDVKPDNALMFKSGINTFSGKCMVDDATAVFYVQTDTSAINKQTFYSGNIGLLNGDKNYNFISYRTGSLGACADAVVVFDDDNADQITTSTPISVLTDIYDGVNDDDEVVKYISLIKQNKELTYELAEKVTITDAQGKSSYTEDGETISYMPDKGDTIRFATNGEGKIVQIQILVDCSRGMLTSASNPNDNNYGGSQFHYIFAKVYDYNEEVLTLCQNIESYRVQKLDMEMYRQISSVPIIVCEKIRGKITSRTGTIEDIESYRQVGDECSYVFVSSRYGAPQSVVIYDNEVMN